MRRKCLLIWTATPNSLAFCLVHSNIPRQIMGGTDCGKVLGIEVKVLQMKARNSLFVLFSGLEKGRLVC